MMQQKIDYTRNAKALTLVELVIASSVMVVILVTMVPVLAGIRNSWDSRQGNAEIVQNARAWADHFQRHLAAAVAITTVSSPAQENGVIEFTGADGGSYRYALGSQDYIQFGPVGNMADLAGPVSRFQLTCYDGNDFGTPTTDAARIRLVTATTTFVNSGSLGLDKTFSCSVYQRSGPIGPEDESVFEPGIALKNAVQWNGAAAVIDSYRSSAGPYSPARAGAEANVSVNATAAGKFTLSGGATIRGNAYIGPGGDPDSGIRVGGGAAITGIQGMLAEAVNIPRVLLPVGLSFAGHQGDQLKLTGTATETLSENRKLNKMQLSGSSRLLIDGHVVLVVNNTATIADQAQLEILPDSSLTMYVGKDLGVVDSAKVNEQAGIPSMLRIYITGNNKDVHVESQGVLHAVVQNPQGDVSVSGQAQFFGKAKAGRLDGGGQIHVDMDCGF